ncbi:tannase/feruloyl esterase family alpha/beta hydrolase [Phenylobacterium montanum]|uniref:Tannase/feruloyl esterase family alpha/beta hydrolase n=1 Tax=Phenylobacterium montanum TaxID=2823693 RepID=A0A975IY95_9CAUL|nr:tannase/feruloyl esterase family alpha/beta hydrolase [Caulobacter sp. S6]QUD90226.1 tannase/feruloyl esterase family alpha/beta hydrolase [Caulobacter sp. S6]
MAVNGRARLLAGAVMTFGGLLAIASPAAAKDCAQMAGQALPQGKVTAATLVPAGGFKPAALPEAPPGVAATGFANLPAFCRIEATLKPSPDSDIKVEVWMPASGWNGKFVGIGNGGWAGSISYFQLGEPLSRGYAVAATDTGHVGNALTGDWAAGHPEKLIDFGYRAVHDMTVAAKAAVSDFYGSGPRMSLWNSCSTGGRQGLMEAFRFPEDYDAISAMAPANPMTGLMTQSLWTGYQAVRSPGAKLTLAKLAVAHKAYIAKCDDKDGLKDGIASNPQACKFDPAVVQCKAGDAADCLTAEQVQTLRAVYGGVRDPKTGKRLLSGWPAGSELELSALMSGPEPFPIATSYMRALVFGSEKGWDFRSFDYGTDSARARDYGAKILDVDPRGLGPFFARGGKLLLSHGWTDGLIPANNTVAFYGTLSKSITAKQTQTQLRLFMIPGMNHCSGGEGPSSIDTLAAIDQWASSSKAPDRLIAARLPGPLGAPEPKQPPMTRPLCAYPATDRYKGVGPADQADSFVCTRTKPKVG